jgi:hypothetical protein
MRMLDTRRKAKNPDSCEPLETAKEWYGWMNQYLAPKAVTTNAKVAGPMP